ncbi:MAG: hypothetical protein J6V72_19820 [Kiritimatiellae bacterium]|nr:hypothetical protein [Kiritimatiellia bacterium]
MKIETDKTMYVEGYEFYLERDLAHVVPNQARLYTKGDRAEDNHKLIDEIAKRFRVYQYDPAVSYDENYDLFFWCNDLYFTAGGRQSGRDYSYFSLGTNKKQSRERQEETYERLRRFCEQYETEAVEAVFTWHAQCDDKAIAEEAKRILSQIVGKRVFYGSQQGTMIQTADGTYIFKKKGARKYGLILSDRKILQLQLVPAKAPKEDEGQLTLFGKEVA